MMQDSPMISVIMPVYNTERYVLAAAESVLGQTFGEFEFIIIDDGSTDGTSAILQRIAEADRRVRLIPQPNAGITPTLNTAIGLARGKYLARMDADDVCLPQRFQLQIDYLEAHPEVLALGTQIERTDPDGAPLCTSAFPLSHAEIDAALLGKVQERWPLAHPTMMIRTDAVRRVGGYDDQFVAGEDRDLWLRLSEIGELANLDEVLLRYRCRPDSISYATARTQQTMSLRAIELACQRRGIAVPPGLTATSRAAIAPSDYRYRWANWALNAGHYSTARKHLWPLLRSNPFCWRHLKVAMKATLPFASGHLSAVNR